ncbi:MAG: putative ABC transporter ATP-binding protein YbhF [Syntrophorhabdaceae bacterium PtaU1.Bin034]|nr:MAG: putative ABC transporter ATP-binding protein YbhF [Syntrophorhabdaceae bacterium PtaU1.Bin034]
MGPDGAGKTTTMRLLAAVLRPSGGEAWVAGHSILHEEEQIKEKIGYMSQRFGLYEDLTVMENILFYADLYGVPGRERPARIERLLGFSNLTPFKSRLAGNLSGGMKQKLGLACALIHTPEVLLLDEPTGGVDPVSRRDFWRILYSLMREGVTILVSTAYLDEAERCARVGLINRGRLLAMDEPRKIRGSLRVPMIEVLTPDARRARELAASSEGVLTVSVYGDKLHIGLDRKERADEIAGLLRSRGIEVMDPRPIMPSLEDVFIHLVERSESTASERDRPWAETK